MARRLLLLIGLATFCLPLFHSAAYGFQAMFSWTNRYQPVSVPNYDQVGTLSYYALVLIRQLSAFAIPAFLFVAGYYAAFTLGRGQRASGWRPLLARVRSLLWPFLIWTIVALALLWKPPTVDEALSIYYFIPLVAQYYLLSLFMVRFAEDRWKALLIVTGLIQLLTRGLRYMEVLGMLPLDMEFLVTLTPIWLFPGRIFYFTLGLVASMHLGKFRAWLGRTKWFLLVAVIVVASLTFVEYELVETLSRRAWLGATFSGVSRDMYAILFIMCFMAFEGVGVPFSKQLDQLGSKSMGIFLINTPVIYVLASLMYHKLPWILGQQMLYQLLLILA